MEPIAIIGMSCRFPGADNPQAFWQLLRSGATAIREVPADRWDMATFYDPDPSASGKMYTRWGGFLDHLDRFDANFFGISSHEAERIDPQQRLLLELCWEALEDSGHVPARLRGTRTGVFIAFCVPEYQLAQMADTQFINSYTNTGYFPCIVSNRISYVFDFRGPSLSLDTACSSSLVALHLACQSLRCGESTLALAGGVNLMVSPVTTIGYSKLGILSPDRQCRAFDAQANGYVRGEGGGILLLKTLAAALADGDEIHAVIRGEAVNQDGRSNGLTAPNRFAQEEVLREAYQQAGVSPGDVQYVEAHGTGTLLGDSIEARALGAVLGAGRVNGSSCAMGSVKTNIGHLESAAGVASLLKVALALKHRMIPPSLHFEMPSPHIPFEELGLKVQRALEPWPKTTGPAVAGVHAYGFGGTNAHVVLEEAPAAAAVSRGNLFISTTEPTESTEKSDLGALRGVGGDVRMARDHELPDADATTHAQLLTISARDPRALRDLVGSYRESVRAADQDGIPFADVCYTAALHRSHHDYRCSIIGNCGQQAIERMDTFLADGSSPGVFSGCNTQGRRTRIAFLFTGQGSQYWGMGRKLYETQPIFRKSLQQCDELLRPYLPQSLLSVLYTNRDSLLDETEYTQPALFAIEYALTRLWHSWGVDPDVVLGHSVGEYAAACVAGVFSLQDAVKLIATRGRLMQDLPRGGAMAAVFAPAAQVSVALEPFAADVSVAAINGPEEMTISGARRSVEAILKALKAEGIAFQKLKVSHAFHSPLMDSILDPFERSAEAVAFRPPRIPLISNLTGQSLDGVPDAAYWRNHIRQPVLFAAGIQTVRDLGCRWAIEIGPQPTLLDLAKRGVAARNGKSGSGSDNEPFWLPSLRRGRDDGEQILESLGALYSQGLDVTWSSLYRAAPRRRVQLPTYHFQRERCWFGHQNGRRPEVQVALHAVADGPVVHPLLGRRHRSAAVIYESQLGGGALSYLQDHRVHGLCVVPAAAYLEMALAAGHESFPSGPCRLDDVVFQEPLLIQRDEVRTVQVTLSNADSGDVSFDVSSLDHGPARAHDDRPPTWTRHVIGRLRPAVDRDRSGGLSPNSLEEARDRCREPVDPSAFYELLAQQGLAYGPNFRGVCQLWRGDGDALGLIRPHDGFAAAGSEYHFHPAWLDSCVHVAAAAVPAEKQAASGQHTYVPIGLHSLRVYRRPGTTLWSHAVLRRPEEIDGETLRVDLRIYEPTGEIAAEIEGLIVKRARGVQVEGPARIRPGGDSFLDLQWRRPPIETASAPDLRERWPWLILADGTGIGAALGERFTARGESCVTVVRSAAPDEGSVQRLLEGFVRDRGNTSIGIVDCWTLDCPPSQDLTLDTLRESHLLGCRSVLHLLHALHELEASVPVRLWLVTRGAQALDLPSSASLAVAQSPMWGLARTIQWEHAELHCSIVDLDPINDDGELTRLDEELHAESRENQVAYRGSQRFVPRLVRRSGDASKIAEMPGRVVIHADATYMITGGMGGLGLRVAKWLVDQGARNLVLVGRRDPSASAHRDIEELQRIANVAVAQADVAQQDDMARLFEEVRETLPPLRGIVHAAGVLDNGLLTQQSVARFNEVAAPKIFGAWNLHVLSREMPLDFLVLFSSVTSVLGSPGQGSYVAANAFLDALAHYRRAHNLPASSIDWGPWAEVGMAAAADDKERARFDGIAAIDPDQGVRMLGEILRGGAPQTVALIADWPRFLERFPAGQEPPILSELARQPEAKRVRGKVHEQLPDLMRQVEAAPRNQRQDVLVAALHDQAINAIGLESVRSIDVRRPFAELGMDSLAAVELRDTLAAAVGRSLPASLLFDYPSIEALAKYLTKEVFGWDDVTEPGFAPPTAKRMEARPASSCYDDLSVEELAGRLAEKLAHRTGPPATSKGAV